MRSRVGDCLYPNLSEGSVSVSVSVSDSGRVANTAGLCIMSFVMREETWLFM